MHAVKDLGEGVVMAGATVCVCCLGPRPNWQCAVWGACVGVHVRVYGCVYVHVHAYVCEC